MGGSRMEVPALWQGDGDATSVARGWRCHLRGSQVEVPHWWQ